jgi:hypothetical protein
MTFHVPERDRNPFWSDKSDGNCGQFLMESPEPGWWLAVIASDGTEASVPESAGWEHVSVHAYRPRGMNPQLRTPTWKEMTFVKDAFWGDDDVVMQLHPRRSEYVNVHPHVLHLWRHADIPTPPLTLV